MLNDSEMTVTATNSIFILELESFVTRNLEIKGDTLTSVASFNENHIIAGTSLGALHIIDTLHFSLIQTLNLCPNKISHLLKVKPD